MAVLDLETLDDEAKNVLLGCEGNPEHSEKVVAFVLSVLRRIHNPGEERRQDDEFRRGDPGHHDNEMGM